MTTSQLTSIGDFASFDEASMWAATLAVEHREEVHVLRLTDGWGLFVTADTAALFADWKERHDPANRFPHVSDPRWSEDDNLKSEPDFWHYPDDDDD